MWQHRPVRIVITALIAAVLLVLLALSAAEEKAIVGRMVGIQIRPVDDGLLITAVGEHSPAARAGLETEDLLIAIDGSPVTTVEDYDGHAVRFNSETTFEYTVERDGSPVIIDVSPGIPFRYLRFITARIGVLAYFILALVVLGTSAEDIRARLLYLFSIAVAIELALPEAAFGQAGWLALIGVVFLMLSGIQMGLELHLASVIPRHQPWVEHRPWAIPAFYAVGLGFGIMAGLAFVADVFAIPAFWWDSTQLTWFFNYVLLPLWAVAVAVMLGREALRHPEPQGRQQAGLVFVGVVPWTVFTLVSVYLPDVIASMPWFAEPLQSIILLCYPVAVFLAIFRHQLFDIELVVRRGLVYTALTIILVLLFYIFVAFGGTLLSMVSSEASSVWVVSAATLLLGLLFSPLRDAVRATIDRRFFPERYALRQQLIGLAEELPELRKLPVMGDYLADRLTEIFGVTSVTLLIGDPETGVLSTLSTSRGSASRTRREQSLLVALDDPGVEMLREVGRPTPAGQLYGTSQIFANRLKALDTTLVVPVASRANLIGLLLLGKRIDSERYPAEELELLSLLSHHVATTFENARLFESATYEGLTGLLRRESIIEQLKAEIARALRYQRPLTIGMADLDHFKRVNDSFGHLIGDATLQRIAKTIQDGMRGTDAVGRYGGEEFLFVLPETHRDDARSVAEKIRTMVEEASVIADDGSEVKVTISIGLASLEDLDLSMDIDATDLIAVADSKLYEAKRKGRNRIEPAFHD